MHKRYTTSNMNLNVRFIIYKVIMLQFVLEIYFRGLQLAGGLTACLVELRGDQEWHWYSMELKQYYKTKQCCPKCPAQNSKAISLN